MYLTRFPLNVSRRETKAMLANPYQLHAAIAASFPPAPAPAEEGGRVLWRVDRLSTGGYLLYIVSPERPSLTGLDEQVGWPDLGQQWETRHYDSFLNSLEEGQRWAFRLRANPVVNRVAIRSHQGEGGSKRISHLTTFQQSAWLIGSEAYEGTDKPVPELFLKQQVTRAQRCGFEAVRDSKTGIPQLVVSDSRVLRLGPRGRRDIALATAQFDGVLEVTDANALRHALTHGIGHGKGFGCGLLTLAPLARN